MKLDPVLLTMACSWSMKAYKDNEYADTTKIESKWTSTTAYFVRRKSVDIIVFRGTQQAADWIWNASAIPVPYAGRFCHGGLPRLTPLSGVKSKSLSTIRNVLWYAATVLVVRLQS